MICTPPPDGANDALIHACESARRLHDQLCVLVDESQRVCPHPSEHRRGADYRNRYPWCRCCHKQFWTEEG